eukprot:2633520-Prymnesium_polylepis.2
MHDARRERDARAREDVKVRCWMARGWRGASTRHDRTHFALFGFRTNHNLCVVTRERAEPTLNSKDCDPRQQTQRL